jgi:hypothetical protein
MQNKNSNTNTVLLVIIILLLCALLFWKMGDTDGKKLFSDDYKSKNQLVIPDNNSNYKEEPTPTPNPTPVVKKPSYDFLKDILVGYPDSVIQECNFSTGTYFFVVKDKVQNGSHLIGTIPFFYSSTGAEAGTCYPTFPKSALCSESMSLCKTVYASAQSFDGEGMYPNGVDKYNLR